MEVSAPGASDAAHAKNERNYLMGLNLGLGTDTAQTAQPIEQGGVKGTFKNPKMNELLKWSWTYYMSIAGEAAGIDPEPDYDAVDRTMEAIDRRASEMGLSQEEAEEVKTKFNGLAT